MKNNVPKDVDAIAGLEMGGIPIATAISLEMNIRALAEGLNLIPAFTMEYLKNQAK